MTQLSATSLLMEVIHLFDALPDILTVKETAEYLKISKKSVYMLLQDNQICYRKIGRIYRIPKIAIREYMKN